MYYKQLITKNKIDTNHKNISIELGRLFFMDFAFV